MQYAVIRRNLKDVTLAAAITGAIVLTLPLLATIAVVVRPIVALGIALVMVLVCIACGLSTRFRVWLDEHDSTEITYRGLHFRTDTRLSLNHCWVREGASYSIGADDLIQAALGPVTSVDLPAVGLKIRQGDPLFRLRSRTRTLEVRSPITGTVAASNDALQDTPGLVNEHPYTAGWIVRLTPDTGRVDSGRLLKGRPARAWFNREVDHFCLSLPKRFDTASEAGAVTSVPADTVHLWIDDSSWRRLASAMFSGQPRHDSTSYS
ncbi:MAG: glycine cleavage system protein H [Planctomycetes bacterium]|nr:glycine cleavage system protein H [Planctomycetota bacterium]NOG54496.1 glycine cleavage system protein H [Planctomycetota bacterium]